MATIRKRNGRWQAQVRRKGAEQASRTFTRKSDAISWAQAMELGIETRGIQPANGRNQSFSLFDLLDRYEREVVPLKRGHEAERYVTRALKRLPLANKRLTEIGAVDFAKFRDERLRSVKASTLQRQVNVLRHAFRTAEKEWGWVAPSKQLADVRIPSAEHFQVDRIAPDALADLVHVLSVGTNQYIAVAVQLAVATGLRRGELLSLKWADISPDLKLLTVRRSKNGHPRTVPLSTAATRLLATMERKGDSVLPISANCLKLAFQRARAKSGTRFRFHDLRHEAISRFFELGLTIPEVQSLSGHRTLSQLTRYAHPDIARIADKLG